MKSLLALLTVGVLLTACGSRSPQPDASGLRSDFPLQTTQYYVDHPTDLATMDSVCTAWKGSQRPPASWPSVVVSNCNNVDAAKGEVVRIKERDKLLKEAGN